MAQASLQVGQEKDDDTDDEIVDKTDIDEENAEEVPLIVDYHHAELPYTSKGVHLLSIMNVIHGIASLVLVFSLEGFLEDTSYEQPGRKYIGYIALVNGIFLFGATYIGFKDPPDETGQKPDRLCFASFLGKL